MQKKVSIFDFKSFVDDVIQLADAKKKHHFTAVFENKTITINRLALQQIFINLIGNSIKYSDKVQAEIEIGFKEAENEYQFYVSYNGKGIDKGNQDKIFQLFEVLGMEDRFGKEENGIGLSIVKKITEGLGGSVSVDSEINKGTKITFSLPKQ